MRKKVMLKIFLALLIFYSSSATSQIIEIPIPQLPDIAVASIGPYGEPVIYYNPYIVQKVGPLISQFFRAHEYGHHALNHIRREWFEGNPYNRTWLRQNYEKEADCFAARNVPPAVAGAAIQFFALTQGPKRPSWYHPTGYERAAVIKRCAGY